MESSSSHAQSAPAKVVLEIPRIKLVLIGQENVGKTSLLRAMRDALAWRKANSLAKRFNLVASKKKAAEAAASNSRAAQLSGDTLSTDGIDVEQLIVETKIENGGSVRAVNFTVLDFAGQEIYYTTHSFFLSERSIFVVVWNLCDETNFTQKISYWLNSIKIHAPKSPIVLVGTHLDGRKGTRSETEAYLRGVFKEFKKNCPRVRAFHAVSCSSGRGIEELLRSLEMIAIVEPYVNQPVPVSHTIFEAFLLMERNVYEQIGVQPILSWQEIVSIAYKCKVIPTPTIRNLEDEDELRAALNYAHLLSSIYYYHNEDISKRLVILDPQWIAKMFASIITTKHLFASKGIISVKTLTDQVWRDYPADAHASVMELFENFEVMFRLPASAAGLSSEQGDVVIIPSTLPAQRPEDLASLWPTLDHSKFAYCRHYQFEFIPNGLFSRYMVRLTRLGSVLRYWQTGVLIQHPRKTSVALVELKSSSNLLQIAVRGADQTSTDMFCTMVELLEFLLVNWFRVQTDIIYIEPRSHATFTQQQLEEASISASWILEATVTDDSTSMVELSHVVKVKMDAVAPELALNNLQALELDIDQDIKIHEEIGEGAYATVYKATLLATGEQVAVKRLRMQSMDYSENADIKAAFNEFRREIMVMSELRHPNIVKLIGFSLQVPFSMVMELIPHDALYKYLETHKTSVSLAFALRVAYDIAEALAFLHSIDYQHRDLKSPNILLNSEDPFAPSVAKVSDFGITGRMYAQQSKAKLSENREVQNPTWLAPEVLRGEGTSPASDVYAFGIILWELVTRQHPFAEFDHKFTVDLEEAIKHGTRPTIPPDCPPSLSALISDCWNPTQKNRPTFQTIATRRLPEIMRELVPELASKIKELKTDAQRSLERQKSELENALAKQRDEIKHLQELRDRNNRSQDSSDETVTGEDEEDGESDEGDEEDEDNDGSDEENESRSQSPSPRASKSASSSASSSPGAQRPKRSSQSLSSSDSTHSSPTMSSSSSSSHTVLTSSAPMTVSVAAVLDSAATAESILAASKRTKGSRKKTRETTYITSAAALSVSELAGPAVASAPKSGGDSETSSSASVDQPLPSPRGRQQSVSGMIKGAVTKLRKFGSGAFGTAGESTLGTSPTSSSPIASDSIDSATVSVSKGGLRGSKPGLLQSTNSTLGGILNDLFSRNMIGGGMTRVSLGGYWRMMEGELRDLLDQRGLILDPAAPQTKADLVQILVDDDAAIAKSRLAHMASGSTLDLTQSSERPLQLSGSPNTGSGMSAKGSSGTSLAMQFDARDATEKYCAITSSFLPSALWRRVKYYVSVSNAIYDLRGEPLQSLSLRDSMANISTSSSRSSSSGSKGRERSATVGGGPLPNSGGVEVKYGLDPLVDLLLSSTDEKTRWNVLATITVLVDQPATRKQLIESSIIPVLVSMLIDLVKSKPSTSTAVSTDADREERISRRTSRLRSVIMALLANLTAVPDVGADNTPQPLPACLSRETEVRLFVRLMRHTYDELKQLERKETSSRSGQSDAIVSAPSFPGSVSSVRAELVASLALIANITSWSEEVAEMIATSETVAREITRGDSSASTSATVDLFTSLLDDPATSSAAATILTNISAKDERLCAIVATRSLVRKSARCLRRSPTAPDDTILTIACLLRNCSSIQTIARYMGSEQLQDALNDLPFNASLDPIIRSIIYNIQEASPQAAMRRKRSLTKRKLQAEMQTQEPLKTHNFVKYSFKSPHWCMACNKFVWGLRNQGQRCTVCHFPAHDACAKVVDTPCPGYVITQTKDPGSPGLGGNSDRRSSGSSPSS